MPLNELDIACIRQWLNDDDDKYVEHNVIFTDDEIADKVLELVTKIYEDLLGKKLVQPLDLDPIEDWCPPELRKPYVEPEALYKRNWNSAEN